MNRYDHLFTVLIFVSAIVTVKSQTVSNSTKGPSNETAPDNNSQMMNVIFSAIHHSNPNDTTTEENTTTSDAPVSHFRFQDNSTRQDNNTNVPGNSGGEIKIQNFGEEINLQESTDLKSNATQSGNDQQESKEEAASREPKTLSQKEDQQSTADAPSPSPTTEATSPNQTRSSLNKPINEFEHDPCNDMQNSVDGGCKGKVTCVIKSVTEKCQLKVKCTAKAQTHGCQMLCETLRHVYSHESGIKQSDTFSIVRLAFKGPGGMKYKQILYMADQEDVMAAASDYNSNRLQDTQVLSLYLRPGACDDTEVVP